MRKIDKNYETLLSSQYKTWLDNLEAKELKHPLSRTYYDDIAMELYKCQNGVCAYTERWICPATLYINAHWVDGKYKMDDNAEFRRVDHAGELDHFDTSLKKDKYWL
jgi:hypothetical protein